VGKGSKRNEEGEKDSTRKRQTNKGKTKITAATGRGPEFPRNKNTKQHPQTQRENKKRKKKKRKKKQGKKRGRGKVKEKGRKKEGEERGK